jgi:hypothetical protein
MSMCLSHSSEFQTDWLWPFYEHHAMQVEATTYELVGGGGGVTLWPHNIGPWNVITNVPAAWDFRYVECRTTWRQREMYI